jgi:hypothetical protein
VTHAIPIARLKTGRGGVLTAAFAGALTVAAGAANGGYFPTSWGWLGLVLGWAALVVLMLRNDVAVSPLQAVFVAAGTAFVGWVALSALWSLDVPQTVLEIERDVVYAVGALVLVVVGRERLEALLVGCLLGILAVCGYGLLTRLVPDRLGVYDPVSVYRLAEPVGYWNALGLLAVVGALLALGLVARAARPWVRASAGASLVLLAATLEFTFSRGSWLALAVGTVVAVGLDRRRLQLLASLPFAFAAPAAAVALCSGKRALTSQGAALADAAREGHRVLALLVGLAALGAGLAIAFAWLESHWSPGLAVRRGFVALLAVAVLAGCGAVVAAYGSPQTIATRAWDAFSAPPVQPRDLNKRLFRLSSNGRLDLWGAALEELRAHPVVGGGAGSYERWWLQHRPVDMKVRDAHSLYLEVLGELGPPGLVLVLLFLGAPLAAIARARAQPSGALVAGAYVAFLLHAGVDWDWEVPVVVLTGLALGAVLLGWGRAGRPVAVRVPGLALAGAVIVVGFGGLVANVELARASSALAEADWSNAATHARRAATWAPWSADPDRLLGESQLAHGAFAAARASFRRAIDHNPGDWELWFDLARSSTGAVQRRALARATALNPLSPEVAEFRRELAQGWVLLDEVQA